MSLRTKVCLARLGGFRLRIRFGHMFGLLDAIFSLFGRRSPGQVLGAAVIGLVLIAWRFRKIPKTNTPETQ